MRDEQTAQYREGVFSVTMVTELRDGTSQAVTIKVDSARLNVDAYNDDLYDRVADGFGRLVRLWESTAPGGTDASI